MNSGFNVFGSMALFFLLAFSTVSAFCQNNTTNRSFFEIELEVQQLALSLLSEDGTESQKYLIHQLIQDKLNNLASFEEFGSASLDSLYMLQKVVSPDNRFFILSGENRLSKEMFLYYGGVYDIMNKRWIPLNQKPQDFKNFEQRIDSDKSWYGALYYKIIPFKYNRQQFYVVMGYAYKDYFRRIKVLDILSIDDLGISFGADVFDYKPGFEIKRMYLEYAAESPATLNFDENENKIVFDNLIPARGLYEGQGLILVPDGSYSAFQLVKGRWRYIDNLY
jgi:hypothetical protein